jgi:hypothetical protein
MLTRQNRKGNIASTSPKFCPPRVDNLSSDILINLYTSAGLAREELVTLRKI